MVCVLVFCLILWSRGCCGMVLFVFLVSIYIYVYGFSRSPGVLWCCFWAIVRPVLPEKEKILRKKTKKIRFMPCYSDFCYLCASLT